MKARTFFKIILIFILSILFICVAFFLVVRFADDNLAKFALKKVLAKNENLDVQFETFHLDKKMNSIHLSGLRAVSPKIDASLDSLYVANIRWFPLLFSKHFVFDSLYLHKVSFTSEKQIIQLESLNACMDQASLYGFYTRPVADKLTYAKLLGYQTGWSEIKLNAIHMKHLELPTLLHGKTIETDSLLIDGLDMYIYRDKNIPPSKLQKMPTEALVQIPITMDINLLKVSNSKLLYEERKPEHQETSKLDLSALSITIPEFSNAKDAKWEVVLTANVSHTLPLKAVMNFDMSRKDGYFTFDATAGPGPFSAFNGYLAPNMYVHFTDGHVSQLNAYAVGNDKSMQGHLTLAYEGLKVKYLKRKEGVVSTVVSAVANAVLPTKRKLIPLDDPRLPLTETVRDSYAPFPSFLVHFMLEGLTNCLWMK